MSKKYDAIVIGTGQAGPTLARRLSNAGKETLSSDYACHPEAFFAGLDEHESR